MQSIILGMIGLFIGTLVILFGGGGAAIYLGILTGLFNLSAASGSSTSLVTALAAPVIPTKFYKWLIGIILIMLGINMLIQKNNHSTTIYHQPHARLQASLFGILGGLMVGVAGMNGGAVILAGLFLLGLKDFQATATSTYVLTFMTITGALFHIASGQVDWAAGLPLMFEALVGAVIAPQVSTTTS